MITTMTMTSTSTATATVTMTTTVMVSMTMTIAMMMTKEATEPTTATTIEYSSVTSQKLNFRNYGICWDILKAHDEECILA